MKKFAYRAWWLADDGVAIEGVEEEILATSLESAKRVAWRKAISNLLDNEPGRIHLEYVREVT